MDRIRSVKKETITVQNHLERDSRLDCWSTKGIGALTHPTNVWVDMILSVNIEISIPEFLIEVFERAQSCMVYGCYHYPLFTLGIEELFRFGESAFGEAVIKAGAPRKIAKGRYEQQQIWAHAQGIVSDEELKRWTASRALRNSVSHKRSKLLLGPNDALNQLITTKMLVEDLFESCEPEDKLSNQNLG
ncbi:MAG: hypothetical protein OIF51_08895 [Cellvibrionaceae bacterium]|nr:hypothetical protein [Cellvibrionaceae bacterium]